MEVEAKAVVTGTGAHRRVEVRRLIDHPIAVVWEALTDAVAIEQWFTRTTIDAREGGIMVLHFGEVDVTATIKALVQPHLLAYSWEQADESTSHVSFDLVETGPGQTLVTVVQTALDKQVTAQVAAGWHTMMDRLVDYHRTGTLTPLNTDAEQQLFLAYEAEVDSARPVGSS